jgi:hypothetical protein
MYAVITTQTNIMRIIHRYLIFEKNKKLSQLLGKLGIQYREEERILGKDVSYYMLEFYLYEDDHGFENNSKQIGKFEIEPQVGTEFSKEDEENAEWFMLSTGQFGYPQPENSYFELTYAKEDVCLHCQIGKQQVNPFRFKEPPRAKNSQFLGLNWIFDEIFVCEKVTGVFEERGIKGARYSSPVLHKTQMALEVIQQLHVDTVLLPGLLTDNLSVEICLKNCGQKKYNYPMRGAMTFKKELFIDQPDFVRTYEWFGSGGSASRPILVSQKVRQIIIKAKMRGAFFRPIVLV